MMMLCWTLKVKTKATKTKHCGKQIIVLLNITTIKTSKQKYTNNSTISRRQSHEHSASRVAIRTFALPYKRQSKAGD